MGGKGTEAKLYFSENRLISIEKSRKSIGGNGAAAFHRFKQIAHAFHESLPWVELPVTSVEGHAPLKLFEPADLPQYIGKLPRRGGVTGMEQVMWIQPSLCHRVT